MSRFTGGEPEAQGSAGTKVTQLANGKQRVRPGAGGLDYAQHRGALTRVDVPGSVKTLDLGLVLIFLPLYFLLLSLSLVPFRGLWRRKCCLHTEVRLGDTIASWPGGKFAIGKRRRE